MNTNELLEICSPIVREIYKHTSRGDSVILHGPGGVGKSYTFKECVRIFRDELQMKVGLTATTGIAAINLSGNNEEGVMDASHNDHHHPYLIASTIHSWGVKGLLDRPIEDIIHTVMKNSQLVSRWRSTGVLFIDEISMLGADSFTKLSLLSKHVRQCPNEPFGGIRLVVGGDFYQLPPVKEKWVFQSPEWLAIPFKKIEMTEPKRYADPGWFSVLLRARCGTPSDEDVEIFKTREKAYISLMGDIQSHPEDVIHRIIPTRLYSINSEVERFNLNELNKLPGAVTTFKSADEIEWREGREHLKPKYKTKDHYTPFLDDAIPSLISLKVGAQVMLKWNIDTSIGLANGSRGVVTQISGHTVYVKWNNGLHTPVDIVTWMKCDEDGVAYRTQIPLINAWAVTIHKSQGCTLDSVVIDIGRGIFTPGQAYVALSRVRTLEGLFIQNFIKEKIYADPEVVEYLSSFSSQ